MVNADKADTQYDQVAQYFIKTPKAEGAIIPTANFEVLPVALAVQRANRCFRSCRTQCRSENDAFG